MMIIKIVFWVLIICAAVIAIAFTASVVAGIVKYNRGYKRVIQCKDCKWYGEAGCAVWIVDDVDRPGENDFCSFAEKGAEE